MSLKLKVCLTELVQALGLVSVICSLPQVLALGKWAAIIGAVATAGATYIKQQIDTPIAPPTSDSK